MSGWTPGMLGEILMGTLMAAIGVLLVVDPAPDAERASTAQLRTGDSADLSVVRRPNLLPGAIFFLMGLFHIFTPRKGGMETAEMFVLAGLLLLFALLELIGWPLRPAWPHRRAFNTVYFGAFGAAFLTLGIVGLRQ